MVYKAIKKNRFRKKYRCLSTGAAQTYDIADFYPFNDHRDDHDRDAPPMETRGGFDGHRRFASTGGYEINGDGYDFKYDYEAKSDVGRYISSPPHHIQSKRLGSHRMFSCITGAT